MNSKRNQYKGIPVRILSVLILISLSGFYYPAGAQSFRPVMAIEDFPRNFSLYIGSRPSGPAGDVEQAMRDSEFNDVTSPTGCGRNFLTQKPGWMNSAPSPGWYRSSARSMNNSARD